MRFGNFGSNDNRTPQPNRLLGLFRPSRGRGSAAQTQPQAQPPAPAQRAAANPALEELRQLRANNQLTPGECEVVDDIDRFHADKESARANRDIARVSNKLTAQALQNPPQDIGATLNRRPSFLLNLESIETLPDALNQVIYSDTVPNQTKACLFVNAIVTSIKDQIEHVEAAAANDARQGRRICPMTMQPEKFRAFLSRQEPVLEEIISACQLPEGRRDWEVKEHLEHLATNYFRDSTGYPGAPVLQPANVKIVMYGQEASNLAQDERGIIANLVLDSETMSEFCSNPVPMLDECGNVQSVQRARQLQGFEGHTFQKKLAVLLIQQTLQEASEVQETLGVQSATNPSHGIAAQQAGKRTQDELHYQGSRLLSDQTISSARGPSRRSAMVEPMQSLPSLERHFAAAFNKPLIHNVELRQWTKSPSMLLQLRGLAEPSARLLAQISPATGHALLQTRAFRTI